MQTTYYKRFDNSCYRFYYLQCTDDDNRSYRNVCNMSFVSFSLAVIFIIRLFSTSAFRVPKLVMSLILEKHFVVLEYFPAYLEVLEQL